MEESGSPIAKLKLRGLNRARGVFRGKGTSGNIPRPGRGGTTPYEQYRLSVTLWEQETSLPEAKRAPSLILKLGGVPEKIAQRHVSKIMGIKDEGDDQAMSKRAKRFLELTDDEYREDAGDTAYENVISFMHIRRVEADLRAYVSRPETAR